MPKSSLQERYKKEIAPQLQKDLGIKNINAVPKPEKIVVNIGLGSYLKVTKDFEPIIENIKLITGQKPVVRKAKKAISNFKLRQGVPIGLSVTLRGTRMFDFLNKLVNIVFPRMRDFQGISTKIFDGKGNCTIGIREHIVFPEINPDEVSRLHGLEITIVTTAKDDKGGKALLRAFGFPFKKEGKQ